MAGISLKPSEASTGGGLLDDVDVTLTQVRAQMTDYHGNMATAVPALIVNMDGGDAGPYEGIYTAGNAQHFVPSDDGKSFVKVGNPDTLNDSCNAMLFLTSLVNAGFPENRIGDDVSVFEGLVCHINRVPAPKRTGLPGGENKGKGDGKICVVTKILTLPWDVKKGGKATTAKTAPKNQPSQPAAAPAATETSDDVQGKAVGVLLEILAAKGGSIAKASVAQEMFKKLAKDADRNAIVQLVAKDEFLKDGPWTFDGATISLG